MGRNIDEQSLIKETYAASLQPERLGVFEEFWEAYIDTNLLDDTDGGIDNEFLQSHFGMALGIVDRIRHDNEDEDYFQRLVISHPGQAFIINQDGKIICANPDAANFIESAASLNELPLETEDVELLLHWSKSFQYREQMGKTPYLFKKVNWGNKTHTTLMLAPISPPQSGTQNTHRELRYYLVAQIDLEVKNIALPAIQEHLGLTQAESKIAMHLANGMSVKEIAKMRGTSDQTVRTQVKRILAKTKTRDIADVVRLMLSLSGKFNSVTGQSQRHTIAHLKNNIIRRYNLILPDGRFMEYVEQGHPNGTPVLQMHSVTNGVILTDEAAQKAVLRKWRFITPSRPGYGNSDPNPTRTPDENIDAAVADFIYLLDHLEISTCHILSGWAGCFSQRFALNFPHRVKGIVQTGSVPIWHISHLSAMKSRHRVILKTSIFAPAAAPYMVRVAKALIDNGKSHLFVEGVEQESQFDLSVLQKDKELLKVIADGHNIICNKACMRLLLI